MTFKSGSLLGELLSDLKRGIKRRNLIITAQAVSILVLIAALVAK